MTIAKRVLLALSLFCAPAAARSPAAPARQHTAVTIDPQIFDRYAGYYQLGPKLAVRLWREDDHYFFGTVGTPQQQEIFPEGPTQFFLKNVPVTLSFAPGEGAVTGMTVNQAGRDIQAARIEQAVAENLSPNRMTPSHAVKNGKRYRYYVSNHLIAGTNKSRETKSGEGLRIAAQEIEGHVITASRCSSQSRTRSSQSSVLRMQPQASRSRHFIKHA